MLSRLHIVLSILATGCLVAACDMEKDVQIDLPEYTPEPVVECYLQRDQPYRLSLYYSSRYFDSPQPVTVPGADVIITHEGQSDTLRYLSRFIDQIDTASQKLINYQSSRMAPNSSASFALRINTPDGHSITGTTTFLPVVAIDTIEFDRNENGEYALLTYFKDPGNTPNFYRYTITRRTPTGILEQDASTDDRYRNGLNSLLRSRYKFKENDTLVVTLYNLEKGYYEFLRTADDADDSNGNPFAQPTRINSMVQGGLGVFTTLSFDRRTIIVK